MQSGDLDGDFFAKNAVYEPETGLHTNVVLRILSYGWAKESKGLEEIAQTRPLNCGTELYTCEPAGVIHLKFHSAKEV